DANVGCGAQHARLRAQRRLRIHPDVVAVEVKEDHLREDLARPGRLGLRPAPLLLLATTALLFLTPTALLLRPTPRLLVVARRGRDRRLYLRRLLPAARAQKHGPDQHREDDSLLHLRVSFVVVDLCCGPDVV